jgi:uronate dehydrogenase
LFDLHDRAAVAQATKGVNVVVHLGAIADEASFDSIAATNIGGTYNVFDAAQRAGARRIVFASSLHAVGFYPVAPPISVDVPTRPDTLYGVSKVFGEALGRYYHDKFGIEVVCVRIGSYVSQPFQRRHLATWISPHDLVALFRRAVDAPGIGFAIAYGASRNRRSFAQGAAENLGYEPRDDAEAYVDDVATANDPHPELVGGELTERNYRGQRS